MSEMFRIETDRAILSWSRGRGKEPVALSSAASVPGRLLVRGRRHGLEFHSVKRSGISELLDGEPDVVIGPHLHEQTDYKLYLQSKGEFAVRLVHRDPNLLGDLRIEDGGRVAHGVINFGSQVGRSDFTVMVDGSPEFDFEVEVFPTKLDYQSDYEQILAEVQETLTGLALEYLRATFKLGRDYGSPQPTHLEWIHLLRHVAKDLDQALRYIAQRPVRGTVREPMDTRVERVKHIDSRIRAAVRRGQGSGTSLAFSGDLRVRERLSEQRASSTLDTPEHRWLSAQLQRIVRRLAVLRKEESGRERSARRDRTLLEIADLERHIAGLGSLEPFRAAKGEPPSGFTSLQLLSAPGYREAYRCCMVLALGLRITGGPLQLSVKDLSTLYEYWCYLALLKVVSEETGQPIPGERLFSISQEGLQVQLKKGRASRAKFPGSGGSEVEVVYNPTIYGGHVLIPQKPDMMVALKQPDWPSMQLVIDAKYRVDPSIEYVERYGCPGPPEDALNVLHRYRDAIVEADGANPAQQVPKRTVVQAAVVYPFVPESESRFHDSRLWQSLDKLGIGSIPLLPAQTIYLREWIKSALRAGGWALADKVIPHRVQQKVYDWRAAASETVLVGVLRSENSLEHLEWVREERAYYAPLAKTQPRQMAARWVSLYVPGSGKQKGAVAYHARVEGIEVTKRRDIPTPWSPASSHSADQLMVLYKLGEVCSLPHKVVNSDEAGRGSRFSNSRWTTRLGLERARTVRELLLETEPEWRLYERLKADRYEFTVEATPPALVDSEHPRGRALFAMNSGSQVIYTGESGFRCMSKGRESYVARVEDVIAAISGGLIDPARTRDV